MNQRPSRHSLRLLSYDYDSPGAYFVTLCTVERKALFEQPDLRTILEETWEMLPQRFPTVKLDTFVIMPDHVHFILWLEENAESGPRLGQVVATYKSLASVAWNHHTGIPGSGRFWQRNYYEHVIRGEFELEQKREYIRNNPLKKALEQEGNL